MTTRKVTNKAQATAIRIIYEVSNGLSLASLNVPAIELSTAASVVLSDVTSLTGRESNT